MLNTKKTGSFPIITKIKNARINDRFFIAPAFNEMILEEKYVGVIQINKFDYLPLKNAAQRKLFEEGQI